MKHSRLDILTLLKVRFTKNYAILWMGEPWKYKDDPSSGSIMPQVHDYTQSNWDDDARLDAPLQEIQGAITAQTPMNAGDEVIICLRCRVNAVENFTHNPETWKAHISFLAPVSAKVVSDATPAPSFSQQPPFFQQIVQQLGTSIQHSGLFQQLERSVNPITHIAVRSRLNTRLDQEWRRMKNSKTPLALILGEVDQQDAYLKTYGEQAYEDCLKQLFRAVNASARRSGDLVTRYQQSTLAILLPNTSLDDAICLAKKIRWRIKSLPIETDGVQPPHHFTMSLGITSIVPNDALTPANLVAGTEASLRQAQRAGGDKLIWQEGIL
jgi:diguanylate cyclase (GGDEF)-like protein